MRQDKQGTWCDRFRFGKSRSKWIAMPGLSETQAKARSARLQELAAIARPMPHELAVALLRKAGKADASELPDLFAFAREQAARETPAPKEMSTVTFRDLGEQWTSGELTQRYGSRLVPVKKSVDNDKQMLRVLCKTIGSVPLHLFRTSDAHRAMSALPSSLRENARRHYRGTMFRLLGLAAYPCEVIERNPLPEGYVGPLADSREKTFIYPDEDALVLTGPAPLERRWLYGCKGRIGARLSEMLKLRRRHFDPRTGELRIDKNISNKPGRKFVARDDVRRCLEIRFGKADPDTLLFQPIGGKNPVTTFRNDLRQAGCTREALYEDNDVRQPVRVHDWRSTFVVLAKVEGRDFGWIMRRTGHQTLKNLNVYDRDAAHALDMNLGQLGPLDELLGLRQDLRQEHYNGGIVSENPIETLRLVGGSATRRAAPPVFTSDVKEHEGTRGAGLIELGSRSRGADLSRGAPLAQVEDAVGAALEMALKQAMFDGDHATVERLGELIEARRKPAKVISIKRGPK